MAWHQMNSVSKASTIYPALTPFSVWFWSHFVWFCQRSYHLVASWVWPYFARLLSTICTASSTTDETLIPHFLTSLRQIGHSFFLIKLSSMHSWQKACPHTAVRQDNMKSIQIGQDKLSAEDRWFTSFGCNAQLLSVWTPLSTSFLILLLVRGGDCGRVCY